MDRNKWVELAGGAVKAGETEDQILSVGRQFLPACAQAVLDGGEATPEYYDWLAEQVKIMSSEAGQEAPEETAPTVDQILEEISHRRVTDVARHLMAHGFALDHDEDQELSDSARGWIRDRLGLQGETTDRGVTYRTRQ